MRKEAFRILFIIVTNTLFGVGMAIAKLGVVQHPGIFVPAAVVFSVLSVMVANIIFKTP